VSDTPNEPPTVPPGGTPGDPPSGPPPADLDPPIRRKPRAALTVLTLASLSASAGAMAGFGSRWGLWDFRTGFTVLEWAAYAALGTSLVALVTLWVTRPGSGRKGFSVALLALVVALPVFALPFSWRVRAGTVPPIHDITTDTNDPPAFVAIAPLRAEAPNPAAYPGPEVAALQREAYPDIRPLVLDEPLPAAFDRALAAAAAEGWEIVATDVAAGRIEATDRTFWFGFQDDVVIRLTANADRTIVDVRSKSRVGQGDAGANAARVRGYLARLAP
jgi:hypothetical protein